MKGKIMDFLFSAGTGFVLLVLAVTVILLAIEAKNFKHLSSRIDLMGQQNVDLRRDLSISDAKLKEVTERLSTFQMNTKLNLERSQESAEKEVGLLQDNCAALRRDHTLLNSKLCEAEKKLSERPIEVSIVDRRKPTSPPLVKKVRK